MDTQSSFSPQASIYMCVWVMAGHLLYVFPVNSSPCHQLVNTEEVQWSNERLKKHCQSGVYPVLHWHTSERYKQM